MSAAPHIISSTLPSSGRAFRIAVRPHVAGVRVEPVGDGDPVLIVANHRITDADRLSDVIAVGRALTRDHQEGQR